VERNSNLTAGAPTSAPQRNDLQLLLGSRWVQMLLMATAVATVTGVVVETRTSGEGEAGTVGRVALEASTGESVVVAPLISMGDLATASVEEAWRRHAVERESQRLAANYVARGYSVSAELARNIHEAALEFDIDPEIAFGLVRAESSFRNQATSPVGAVGLTQLMPRTAAWIQPGVTRAQLRNPRTNLEVGFKYLRYLLDKYEGNEDLALLAYNRGPGTVDRALRRGANPDNGYAAFVRGEANHGHRLFTNRSRSPSRGR
jgi:soluble lytic murein transglycosylase-like protein